ncbi:MAG: rhodanese-like domain-containing protein [Saprospiraceae bacterium]|nr:MAG: rhodanese-like protein [Bacteroidetes bacterium OLB9]MCO6462972.1 rhodanese-like domain-containing protein [Saprospiraceae bacterium]MCZ2336848.1 rhodanese-like domain-containing protein [Chitinophagales bacterium]
MEDITVEELKQKIYRNESFVFIDVREPEEYEQANLGAELIPLGTLPDVLPSLLVHREKEIIIHCRSGARSGNAKLFLVSQGFTNVRNVLGGILEWERLYGLHQ